MDKEGQVQSLSHRHTGSGSTGRKGKADGAESSGQRCGGSSCPPKPLGSRSHCSKTRLPLTPWDEKKERTRVKENSLSHSRGEVTVSPAEPLPSEAGEKGKAGNIPVVKSCHTLRSHGL